VFFVLQFDLLLLRYFITSGIRAEGFKICCSGDFPLRSRAASRSVVFFDQRQSRCLAASCSFAKFKATVGICEIRSEIEFPVLAMSRASLLEIRPLHQDLQSRTSRRTGRRDHQYHPVVPSASRPHQSRLVRDDIQLIATSFRRY
jgi:hypothetical protein